MTDQRIEPLELDDDWLDAELMAGDESQLNWRRRALNGMTVAEAMATMPRRGSILLEHDLEAVRRLKRVIRRSGSSQGQWMRDAVAMRLNAEGHTAEAKAWTRD